MFLAVFAAIGIQLGLIQTAVADDRIIAFKFGGIDRGETGILSAFVKGKDGWTIDLEGHRIGDSHRFFVKSEPLPKMNCVVEAVGTLFQQNQLFPLNKYIETGYMTLADVEKYLKGSMSFSDRPVNFYAYASDRKPEVGASGITSIARL